MQYLCQMQYNTQMKMTCYCFVCDAVIAQGTYCGECGRVVKVLRQVVQAAVRQAGLKITKGTPCAECGKAWAMVLEHRRYSMPLSVAAVCRSCNIKLGPALDVVDLVKAIRNINKPVG